MRSHGVLILQWSIALWLGGLMLGITGLSIYLSLFTAIDPKKTSWHGVLLYRLGQGLIGFAVALIVFGVLVSAARGVWLALGGQ